MNLDLFRADLADLAEDVTPVDVRDRVLATSRRIGRRRAIGGVAAAVAFLASEQAGYITGQTLSVSGGLTMA